MQEIGPPRSRIEITTETMKRYEWLQREVEAIPRKKFFVFERRGLADLTCIEARYGALPSDYREFVQEYGQAKLFRSVQNPWYNLMVWAPPLAEDSSPERGEDVVRIKLGHYINSGYAWLEWAGGTFRDEGAIFVGLSGQRRKAATSFAEWLKGCFPGCRRLYRKREWDQIMKPAAPFNSRENCIVDAIAKFAFRKAGVTGDGNLLVEVDNRSSLVLSHLTVGVRCKAGMTGSSVLSVSGISPGTTGIIEQAVYKGVMDPHEVELFSLPKPEPEDRPYYRELLEIARDGLCEGK